jgi:hypothetical protein
VSLPYLAIVLDIGSWWLTKYLDPAFAYVVFIGGAGMGLALTVQIFISLWDCRLIYSSLSLMKSK